MGKAQMDHRHRPFAQALFNYVGKYVHYNFISATIINS